MTLVLLTSFLLACGGGISLSGVGSGGSGLAEGSISGFGSVIVNGVVVIDQSHHCGATPGVVLKRRRGELGLVA